MGSRVKAARTGVKLKATSRGARHMGRPSKPHCIGSRVSRRARTWPPTRPQKPEPGTGRTPSYRQTITSIRADQAKGPVGLFAHPGTRRPALDTRRLLALEAPAARRLGPGVDRRLLEPQRPLHGRLAGNGVRRFGGGGVIIVCAHVRDVARPPRPLSIAAASIRRSQGRRRIVQSPSRGPGAVSQPGLSVSDQPSPFSPSSVDRTPS